MENVGNSTNPHGNVVDGGHATQSNPIHFSSWDNIKQHPEFRKLVREEAERMLEENKKRNREYSPHRSETNDHKHDHHKRERREHERVHQYHKTEHTKSDRQKSEHGRSVHVTPNKQNECPDKDIERKKRERSKGESSSSKYGANTAGMLITFHNINCLLFFIKGRKIFKSILPN